MINFITISAPSGSGKTTLCKALQLVEPEIEWSISYTTREKRSIEENGVDYFFISNEEFEDLIICLLYTSPSPRDMRRSRMPSSA